MQQVCMLDGFWYEKLYILRSWRNQIGFPNTVPQSIVLLLTLHKVSAIGDPFRYFQL